MYVETADVLPDTHKGVLVMSNAIKAGDVFVSLTQRTAFPYEPARHVQKGEKIALGFFEVEADQVYWYLPSSRNVLPVEDAESFLAEHTIAPPSVIVQPHGATVKPVRKGETFISVMGGVGFEQTADTDGYLLEYAGDVTDFWEKAHFDAIFGGETPDPDTFRLLRIDRASVQFVILTEETTFDFAEGEVTVPAGYVLYKDNEDVDGYVATPSSRFFGQYVCLAE